MVAQKPRRRRAQTLQERERQIISSVMDAVEKRVGNGTASASEYVHFLRLGSTLAEMEKANLASKNALLQAQVESLQSQSRLESLVDDAINAMKRYQGEEPVVYDDTI